MSQLKIGITGGTGLIGKYTCQLLLEEGYEISVLTRDHNKVSDTEGLAYCGTDYSIESLVTILGNFNAVVHLAAQRGNGQHFTNYLSNIEVTENIYKACLVLGISNIVYASSISVYSNIQLLPWKEDQHPEPVSAYGLSKLTSEHIGALVTRNSDLKIKNLRLAHVFGANEKNNYMINLFMRKAYNKLDLQLNSPAVAKREFLYASDAARAIVAALKQPNLSGSYNITGVDQLTNFEVAKIILDVMNPRGSIDITYSDAVESIEPSYMDGSKALDDLDYMPKFDMKCAMEEIKIEMDRLDDVPIIY